jgi:hypothetical protein
VSENYLRLLRGFLSGKEGRYKSAMALVLSLEISKGK